MAAAPPLSVPSYNAIVGHALAVARKRARLDQQAAASHLKMTQAGYSKIETGSSTISVETVNRLATLFETSAAAILANADVIAKKWAIIEAHGIARLE